VPATPPRSPASTSPCTPRPSTLPGPPADPVEPCTATTRRDRVTAIMSTDPSRAWRGRELAKHLKITPKPCQSKRGERHASAVDAVLSATVILGRSGSEEGTLTIVRNE